MKKNQTNNEDFGLSPLHPVETMSIRDSEMYLAKLVTVDDDPIRWERLGSTHGPNHGGNVDMPIDIYKIETIKGIDKGKIYISPYASQNSTMVPNGFKIRENSVRAYVNSILKMLDEDE